jgi:E3 ubiquitin-protein ligase UBR1
LIAIHFASIYHRIIDAYLLVDREAETSIKYFALQLFTVPSVALHIVREHRLVARLLSIITAFFTSQIVDKRIAYPLVEEGAEVNVESMPFKSKRFMPVFSDLRYLCHNAPVQRLIAREPRYLEHFAHTCQLFMCVNANKRASGAHVEYETDAWISVFNVTLSLSRVIKVYGEAFRHAAPAELVAAITTVVRHTLMVCTLSTERLDRTKFGPVEFHKVSFGGRSYEVVLFDVLEGWVSFHHSLHWLLAELLKHTHLLTEQTLQQVGLGSLRDVMLRNASERAMRTLFDFPLRGRSRFVTFESNQS